MIYILTPYIIKLNKYTGNQPNKYQTKTNVSPLSNFNDALIIN